MEYGKLGNTDIEVSKLCVGCMSFGKAGTMHDWTLDEAESENVIKHALDLGYNFFDTANGYSAGTSEEYLGKALKKRESEDDWDLSEASQPSCLYSMEAEDYCRSSYAMQPAHDREYPGTHFGFLLLIWRTEPAAGE